MATILITGANGQVGRELYDLSSNYSNHVFHFTDRHELDITQAESIRQAFHSLQPQVVINCAAYTAVDRAESEAPEAERINAEAPGLLAQACTAHSAFLIQLSTDYVYDNGLNRPLDEQDPLHPQSVYARTKRAGEVEVWKQTTQAMVIRTSWVYSAYGHNFVKTMLRLGRERDALRIVYDQVGTPTYARDLAHALLAIVDSGAYAAHPGTYNYSNEGVTSWYDFALAIFAERQITCQVTPIRSTEYPTPASRPAYSLLDKALFKQTFGLTIPHWLDSLRHCLNRLDDPE